MSFSLVLPSKSSAKVLAELVPNTNIEKLLSDGKIEQVCTNPVVYRFCDSVAAVAHSDDKDQTYDTRDVVAKRKGPRR